MVEHCILNFFTSQACDDLISAARSLNSLDDWLGRADAIAKEPGSIQQQEWKFGSDVPQLDPAAESDGANAILIHRFLGNLSPQQASDRRLWTFLSMVMFGDYTSRRWPLADSTLKGKWSSRAEERWLQRSESRTGIARNSISRLWWAASITVDLKLVRALSAQTQNPYAYTELLASKQDRLVAILERNLGARGELLFAMLDLISAQKEAATEKYMRELAKELILIDGYQELSVVDQSSMVNALQRANERVMSNI